MKRAVWTVLAGLLLMLAPASSAMAISVPHVGPSCKTAPTPEVPGRGVVGFFESPPKVIPSPGNPWAPNSTTSIFEQYGYAGLTFNTYDLGCGPDLARQPAAVTGSMVANWLMLPAKMGVAATGALLAAAFHPDFLSGFDPLISQAVTSLQHAVFEKYGWLAMAVLGFGVIWRARSQKLASTATAIGGAILIMILATVVFRWPLIAGRAADNTVTSTLSSVTASLDDKVPGGNAGVQATAEMHDSLLYQAWLGATFGSTDSATALKYGPIIFDSTALTWAQAQTLQDDPAAGQAIIQQKKAAYTAAAAEIQQQDPDAYDYLKGLHSDQTVGFAVLADVSTLCVIPFLLMAALLVLGALVIVRLGVMMLPAFALPSLVPEFRHLITGLLSTVAAALINAMIFGVAAAVDVLAVGMILAFGDGTPMWLKIILILILTICLWVATRPFRRLTQMVGRDANPFKDAISAPAAVGRAAAGIGLRAGLAAITGGVSGAVAGQVVAAAVEQSGARQAPQRAESQPSPQPTVYATAEDLPATRLVVPGSAGANGRHAIGSGALSPSAVFDPPPDLSPSAAAGRYESAQTVIGEVASDGSGSDDSDDYYLVGADGE